MKTGVAITFSPTHPLSNKKHTHINTHYQIHNYNNNSQYQIHNNNNNSMLQPWQLQFDSTTKKHTHINTHYQILHQSDATSCLHYCDLGDFVFKFLGFVYDEYDEVPTYYPHEVTGITESLWMWQRLTG